MSLWGEKATKAKGKRGKITVEPEDWDEARLRALCARHGWEFEWMTEELQRTHTPRVQVGYSGPWGQDGERRRRIEGAQRARKVAQKTSKKASSESSGAAWWRLGSVSAAFGGAHQQKKNPARRITMQDGQEQPPTQGTK
eukprot:s1970_g2.t1